MTSFGIVETVIREEWPQIDVKDVIGPLTRCLDCSEWFCLMHDAHYADCSCPGVMGWDDEEEEKQDWDD